ncbi:MAG: Nif3-like dinuclear metal center hexameric protein [Actinomycetes bacterium]|jgi:dinuclear metal center YbgI/SA1388 family protein|nr:Nif3-like dinuclear metal center hexameric protein [Actinomycetes bacterium]
MAYSELELYEDRELLASDIVAALEVEYPVAQAAAWDSVGLLVGDARMPVSGVIVALDPSLAAIAAAVERGANVVVSHHPVFIDPPEHFDITHAAFSWPARVVHAAISSGVALVNAHTNLDVSAKARALWGERLELEDIGPLPLANAAREFPHLSGDYPSFGELWHCEMPRTLNALAAEITSLTATDVRVYGDGEALVDTVATATGSATARIPEALLAKADVLIGGEFRYHDALGATESGLNLIELGHDVSELPLLPLLTEALHVRTSLDMVQIHEIQTDPIWNGISTSTLAGGN